MTTESRERSDGFHQCDIENHHVYDCHLCDHYHVLDDDAGGFICPYAEMRGEAAGIIFHPNE